MFTFVQGTSRPLETADFGPSVYAHVDPVTLAAIDRCCDERTVPRSWLITQILHDWADVQTSRHNETIAA